MRILIPARKNSKGIPFKNRKLFNYTAEIIPESYRKITYVFSDDNFINVLAEKKNFELIDRSPSSCTDKSTTKEMMVDFCSNFHHPVHNPYFDNDDTIVMLYLTYPNRKWSDVLKAIDIFKNKNLNSLLCKKDIKQSPYLMMFDLPENKGEQIIKHSFSRRQDYRECFELCHYISIIKQSTLENLNSNLYNQDTYFMKINDTLDVDTKEDIECIQKS